MTATKHRTKRRQRAPSPSTVRVAIYCRKSVTEGLDQEFNSLDAQRAAVESYVKSQQGEGWIAVPKRYDDGGFTGSNTARPAFPSPVVADPEADSRSTRTSQSRRHSLCACCSTSRSGKPKASWSRSSS